MPENLKRRTLIFLFLAILVTVLIAAALPALNLSPGIPLPFNRDVAGRLITNQQPMATINISTFLKALVETILVALIVYLVYSSRKGLHWKEILLPALVVSLLTFLAVIMMFALFDVHVNFAFSAPEVMPPGLNIMARPLGPPPAGLVWLVLIGLAVLTVLLGSWFFLWRKLPPAASLESEALQAIQALHSGAELKDVILRCYVQMSRVLQKEQKLELTQAMTAREFERLLEARGFPALPVHQLTGLFEKVRYGHHLPGPGNEQQALECLQAIVQHSRLIREAG